LSREPYDSNGNLTTKVEGGVTWTYVWDAENRLKWVCNTTPCTEAAAVASFKYDPLGRRVEKVAGSITTSYTYDGINILREATSTGVTLKYVHGRTTDEPLAQEDGAGVLNHLHADGLGSIVKMTNSAGVVVATRRYDAFGNLELGATNGYSFTGREWDSETGLYYYRFRYYDPKVGRFVSADPLGFAAGVNFYAYVKNRPITHTDPLGLQSQSNMRSLPVQYCDEVKAGSGTARTGLCCKDGQYVLCAERGYSNYSERAKQCTQYHEMAHVRQRDRDPKPPCGGECSGEPCTTLTHPEGTGGERECRAWWVTYLCFMNTGERDPDGDLWQDVARRIVNDCRRLGFFP
jgi:RHS repeat-associated protein